MTGPRGYNNSRMQPGPKPKSGHNNWMGNKEDVKQIRIKKCLKCGSEFTATENNINQDHCVPCLMGYPVIAM